MQTQNGGRRRAPEDFEELSGLLTEAEGLLEGHDPRGASEALRRAGVKAATMWGGVGVPALPGTVRDLISSVDEARSLAASGDGQHDRLDTLLGRVEGLRAAFEREAKREAGVAP